MATTIDAIGSTIVTATADVDKNATATIATVIVGMKTVTARERRTRAACACCQQSQNPSPSHAQSTPPMATWRAILGLSVPRTQPTARHLCQAAIAAATTAITWRHTRRCCHARDLHCHTATTTVVAQACLPTVAVLWELQTWTTMPPLQRR